MANVRHVLGMAGIDPGLAKRSAAGLRIHRRNRDAFMRQAEMSGGEFPIGDPLPCLPDRFEEAGVATGHYFHQDLLVAQMIFDAAPERHIDVGSRVDGFVAHVASYRSVDVLDIRPVDHQVRNITFYQRDITQPDPAWDDATDSLSCLHAIEHFGLGRYGDPVDYYGYQKGWDHLTRMIRPGGRFYFAVPISEHQRVEFDAHRVFSVPFIRETLVGDRFDIESFAYVDDSGDLHDGEVDVDASRLSWTVGLRYGCGIFTLRRR